MPITFPAHAAAVFALGRPARTLLPGTALLVGTAVPDFAFAVRGQSGVLSHQPIALLWFALPLGLLIYLSLEALILPALRLTTPGLGRFQPARLFESRGRPSTGKTWALAALGILIGAATHLLLDGLSHDGRFPASVLYPGGEVPFFGKTISYATLAHRLTSYFGTVVVAVWALVRAVGPGLAHARSPRLFPILLLSSAATFASVAQWKAGSEWAQTTLSHAWPLVAGGWFGLCASSALVLCLTDRERRRLSAPA